MFAFANAALPVRSFSATLANKAVSRAPVARSVNTVTMRKSEAMPFANAPAGLPEGLPAGVGFDPLGFSDVFDSAFRLTCPARPFVLEHVR
jgi:hypothetical protein